MALAQNPSSSLRFGAPPRPYSNRIGAIGKSCVFTKRFASQVISINRQSLNRKWVLLSTASDENSKHSDVEVRKAKNEIGVDDIEVEKAKNEIENEAEETNEVWKQAVETWRRTLESLKERGMSKEAYELYSKKAMVILKETSENLKIQAEKASQDLSILAKEIGEEGKEYLTSAVENSPEEVKDIVETFASSTDDIKDVRTIRDFYVGIPYGAILSIWGFCSFMLTGSISAVRFGVILGGALLALSISSLRSWKRGESSALARRGQEAITFIIFMRNLRVLSQRPSLLSSLGGLISGLVGVFYIFRIVDDYLKKSRTSEQGLGN